MKIQLYLLLSILLIGNCLYAVSYSEIILGDNPLSYWRLNETSGTTAKDEKNVNNAVYVGSPTLGVSSGILGDTGISLGTITGQSVTRSSFSSFPTTAISVEFWMKSNNSSTAGTPFSYAITGTDNEFLIYDYNSLSVYIGGAYIDTGKAINDGLWHQIAVTWQSSTGSLNVYKDGASIYQTTLQTGYSIKGGGTLMLGQEQDSVGGSLSPDQRFIGSLDDFSVYNYALSSSQILYHYQTALGIVPEPTSLSFLFFIGIIFAWGKFFRK